jgi:hypothetical protein
MSKNTDIYGFITLGESYAKSAEKLISATETNEINLRHDAPIYYLLSHSLELLLKGLLLSNGKSHEDVEKFGHHLKNLYDVAKCEQSELINGTESHVKSKWRTNLQKSRDEHKQKFIAIGITEPEDLSEWGVHENSVIGSELPVLPAQVDWLSARHTYEGGLFRYHQTRYESIPHITAFGLNMNVVFYSTLWACEYLGRNII